MVTACIIIPQNCLAPIRFLKEPGHADAYEGLKITFIHGENPRLLIKDDKGATTETIELAKVSAAAVAAAIAAVVTTSVLNNLCGTILILIFSAPLRVD